MLMIRIGLSPASTFSMIPSKPSSTSCCVYRCPLASRYARSISSWRRSLIQYSSKSLFSDVQKRRNAWISFSGVRPHCRQRSVNCRYSVSSISIVIGTPSGYSLYCDSLISAFSSSSRVRTASVAPRASPGFREGIKARCRLCSRVQSTVLRDRSRNTIRVMESWRGIR